jgi:ABC-type sugar transport system substrate-binding protein
MATDPNNRSNGAALLGAAVAVGTLLGASIAPAYADDASKGKKVAYLESIATHPYVATMTKAFRAQAEAQGMEVTTFASGLDAALQARQVDDVIARKYDFLALQPLSEQGIVPALLRAKQTGKPVLIVNNPVKAGTGDLYLSFVGQDQTEMGRMAGELALKALKESGRDGGKIALITGALQEGIGPRRIAGFREALKANPKAEIVAVEDAHWDTATSERLAGQLYARFAASGGLDLVYGMADNQAVAAIRAAEAAGIPVGTGPKQLIVVGGNCLKEGLGTIRDGKEYGTLTQSPTDVGKRAADLVAEYFNGKKLPKEDLLPVVAITKANVDQWQAACTY